MKRHPGDISIVENVGTFLMWYDTSAETGLTSLGNKTNLAVLPWSFLTRTCD